ncbi:translocation/assembly module TamB domain-containing protein [Noviherbaspirillum sp. ST9]|uniref:translocation/assembly module TamB domain-containing protein n=1 Tax=Noviherbaspirillum sp. ST9 TaxID=3401606 RepID=UPI003B5872CF
MLIVLAVAVVLAMLFTEPGARLAWQAATRLLPMQLSGEVSGGTLASGLELRDVVIEDKSKRIHIDRLEGRWNLTRSPLLLTIDRLHAGKVDITQRPSPPEPASLPQEITLPLAVDLRSASVDTLTIRDDDSTRTFRDILLRARSDGEQHHVTLEHAATPFGKAAASLDLGGRQPFPVSGNATLESRVQEKDLRLAAQFSGSLREPVIHLDATGEGLRAQAKVAAAPFSPVPLRRAEIQARDLDPRAINPAWPKAEINVDAQLVPVEGAPAFTVAGPVSVTNAKAGTIDAGLLPLAAAKARLVLDAERQKLEGLSFSLNGGGTLTGSGELHGPSQGQLVLQASGIDMHALHTALQRSALDGPLQVKLDGDMQHVEMRFEDKTFSIAAVATLVPAHVTVESLKLQAADARLEASGTLAREGDSSYKLSGTLNDFNPARFLTATGQGAQRQKIPPARINMQFDVQGALQPLLRAAVDFNIRNSTYAGLPMTGSGTVRVAGKEILPSDARVSIAGNHATLKGSFGEPDDRLHITVDAPALGRLGFGLSGVLRLDGELAGSVDRPKINAQFRAEQLALGPHRAARLSGQARMDALPGVSPDAAVNVQLDASGVRSTDIRLDRLSADVDGTWARHAVTANARGQLRGKPLDMRVGARGALTHHAEGLTWDGVLQALENTGFPRVSLDDPLSARIAPGAVTLGASRIRLEGAQIDLQGFQYNDRRIRTEGAFRGLEVARLLDLRRQLTGAKPPLTTDLVLDGDWSLTLADRASGFVQVERRSGDINLPQLPGKRGVDLDTLSARADFDGLVVALRAHAAAGRLGTAAARARIPLQESNGRLSMEMGAPLSGHVEAAIPQLQTLGLIAGPNIILRGRAALDLDIGGTLADPSLTGPITGDGLVVTMYDQGIQMHDGIARLQLQDNVVQLQRVEFRSGPGTLRASGSIPLDPGDGGLRANIVADNFQLLSNPSSLLILSGQAQAVNAGGHLQVTGKFVVDRALFDLPEKTPPKLGDDVIVLRGGAQEGGPAKDGPLATRRPPAGPFSPSVDIHVDLGNNFRFEGSGAELLLAGALDIRSAPGEAPQAYGTIRVVKGTYEAFGAELDIERGVINFQGPFSNPNINILAMRRDQEVAAGVRVSGTPQRPRVQLVSEPNVPDEEKLSWLVFGSGGGGNAGPGQAQAAAKGAALGLLNKFGAERLAGGLGLDELSIGESEFGLAGQQVVNLGKTISDRLFIGYEQSLASAESVLKLTYEMTRNWSVVLRGGAVTGIDVYFSKRFDSLR